MKKLILIAAVAFTACNSASTEVSTSCDSTCVDSSKAIIDTVKIDSVKVIDSTSAKK